MSCDLTRASSVYGHILKGYFYTNLVGTLALLFGVESISEVDAHKRFVPNDPRVVPRRNRPHIARTKLCFGTIVHSDHYPPRDDVDEVANLATVCPNSRFDTLRTSAIPAHGSPALP